MRRRTAITLAVLAVGAAAQAAAPTASGATREFWVAAVPVTWNIVPNQRDAITGVRYDAAQSVLATVVYRRYTRGWKRALPNMPRGSGNSNLVPGPLLRLRVGDRALVHFKNMDPEHPHSMHFHGVEYEPSSDGAFLPGFSGPDGNVRPGRSYTYELRAGADSAGAWPYHDHSPAMEESIAGGMYGMLSIFRRDEPLPDREFVVAFAPMGQFQAINGRAFVGNTPVFRSRVGDRVRWDVMGMVSDHHTFHVHGHRWLENGVPRDTKTVGPAESFAIDWREKDPGTWLYHCHVEQHMMSGMIGIYQVRR